MQPKPKKVWQLLFDQFFTWPTDQPRHATSTYSHPVEADRPLKVTSVELVTCTIITYINSYHRYFCMWLVQTAQKTVSFAVFCLLVDILWEFYRVTRWTTDFYPLNSDHQAIFRNNQCLCWSGFQVFLVQLTEFPSDSIKYVLSGIFIAHSIFRSPYPLTSNPHVQKIRIDLTGISWHFRNHIGIRPRTVNLLWKAT